MLRPRIIVCLDVQDGRVVKGTRFRHLRDVGDPVELARRYEAEGADEIVFLDITASHEDRGTLLDTVRRTAEVLFIPLTVGGGVGSVEDMDALLRAGADKVSVNSGAVRDPALLTRGAERFGSQCVVASIDAAWSQEGPVGPGWYHHTHGGRKRTDLEAVAWARECVDRGAGEILLTSMDRDGVRTGYDLELTRAVARAVTVPVIASGGAGKAEHLRDAFAREKEGDGEARGEGHAEASAGGHGDRDGEPGGRDAGGEAAAVLVAGILHDGLVTVGELKEALTGWGIPVRPPGKGGGDVNRGPERPEPSVADAPGPGPAGTDRRLRASVDLNALAFNDRGLIPVIAQEVEGGAVLMMAWADRDALERTLETGFMHYRSRSRDRLWKKGETSGNVQEVVSLHGDCDGDTVLARVRSAGPACHTGEATCFGEGTAGGAVLTRLWATLESRLRDRPEGSYTTKLLADENLRTKKLGEETAELIAALSRGDPEVAEEAADLLYHVLVALLAAGRSWSEVEEALGRRQGP